jgi:DNA-binding MarR family transcriptional regulator
VDDIRASGPTRTAPALVQLLARAGGVRVAAAFAAQGLAGLRPVHSLVLVPLLGGGRHASDLAVQLGVSRQAVAQVVAKLEHGGYVERVADPGDARAKLICLTTRGRDALRVVRATAQAVERDWETRLGQQRLAEFRDTLTTLLSSPDEADRIFEVVENDPFDQWCEQPPDVFHLTQP